MTDDTPCERCGSESATLLSTDGSPYLCCLCHEFRSIERERDALLAAAYEMVSACYAPLNEPVYERRQAAIDKLKELSGWQK